MFFCYECCVLSDGGLCDELITRSEESYRLWCVGVCDLETSSRMRRPWPALGCSAIGNKKCCFLHVFDIIPCISISTRDLCIEIPAKLKK